MYMFVHNDFLSESARAAPIGAFSHSYQLSASFSSSWTGLQLSASWAVLGAS